MPKKYPLPSHRSAYRLLDSVDRSAVNVRQKVTQYLKRRPHRSFRRTYRRDYARSLALPGYWSFTHSVFQTLWQRKDIFIRLIVIYAVISAVMVGFASQESYGQLSDTISSSGGELFSGNWGAVGKAGLLFLTTISGGANSTPTEAQQIYGIIIVLLAWLSTVWLLRNVLAGHTVRLRDGLYNSGSPILPMALISLLLTVQLLPLALALIGYSAATASGLLSGGAEAMLFWAAAGLLATLSLYWATSTFFALIVVTLPGMYPLQALRTAGDLVVGRRLRILLRLLWLFALTFIAVAIVMLLVILLDAWVKSIVPALVWLPLVPLTLLILSSASVIWTASYTYLLYRKVVEDDAQPA